MPPQRIGAIVAGKRAFTADTDLRLCRYFGLNALKALPTTGKGAAPTLN